MKIKMPQSNSFGAASTCCAGGNQYRYYALEALEKRGANISRIPYSIKILLENLLRTENGATVEGVRHRVRHRLENRRAR